MTPITPAAAARRIAVEPAVNLTVTAAALGISVATASRLVAADTFPVPFVRMGSRIVVPTPALRELLQLSPAPEDGTASAA